MTRTLRRLVALAAASFASQIAFAHIGVVNETTPISASGQSAFAVANSTNVIQFLIPHGCTSAESTPAFTGANLDTYRVEITIPAAIVTATTVASLRPSMEGVFGTVTIGAPDTAGNVKLTWTRKLATAPTDANYTASDNQLYKVSVRLRVPNLTSTTDTTIRKYQFPSVQYCRAGSTEYAMDWGTANSPTLLVFPEKRAGFNKYTLHSTTVGDFTTTGTGTLAARLRSYFGDAAILWVGKAGYSANANTAEKIQTLIAKDATYSNLGTAAGRSLTTTDTIWVRY
jgi:hypothetical protein